MRNDLFSLREEESLKAERDAISSVKSQVHEPAMELLAAKKVSTAPSMEATQEIPNNPFMQTNGNVNEQDKVRVRKLDGPIPMRPSAPPTPDNDYVPTNNVGSGMGISGDSSNFNTEHSWFNQTSQMGASTLNTLIIVGFVVLVVLVVLVTFTVLRGIGY